MKAMWKSISRLYVMVIVLCLLPHGVQAVEFLRIDLPISSDCQLKSVATPRSGIVWPIQNTTVFISARISGRSGVLLRSTDAGSTWQQTQPCEGVSGWLDLEAITPYYVWLGGYASARPLGRSGQLAAIMLCRYDAETGTPTCEMDYLEGENGDKIEAISFGTATAGIAVGTRGRGDRGPLVLVNRNAGPDRGSWSDHWAAVPVDPAPGYYDVINRIGWQWGAEGALNSWMVGGEGTLLREDLVDRRPRLRARTWSQVRPEDYSGSLLAVDGDISGHKLWVARSDGRVMRSENGGQNWHVEEVRPGRRLIDIRFQDTRNGWVCGEAGTLYETRDGGETWTSSTHTLTGNLNKLALVPGQRVYVVGDNGAAVASEGIPEVIHETPPRDPPPPGLSRRPIPSRPRPPAD